MFLGVFFGSWKNSETYIIHKLQGKECSVFTLMPLFFFFLSLSLQLKLTPKG